MKRDKYMPYGFDEVYEFMTYKSIGKDYKNAFSDKTYIIPLFQKVQNKLERAYYKDHKKCDTYSDWEEYAKSKLPTHISNYDDFLHWLEEGKRSSERFFESIKTILIPIYIAFIPLFELIFSIGGFEIEENIDLQILGYQIFYLQAETATRLTMMLIILIVLIWASHLALIHSMQSISFWTDYLKIAKKYNPKK